MSLFHLRPHTIVLSGGGVRALAHIGALEELEAHKILSKVKKWVGLSAGALVAFTMTIGYSIKELRDICERIDFEIIQDLEEGLPFTFFETFGIDTGQRMRKFLTALLTVRGFSATTTFEQLAIKRPITQLQIYATDLHTGTSRSFSAVDTPSIMLVDALQASMALPIYFKPIVDPETGHSLTDGGVMGLYPRALVNESAADKDILGLILSPRLTYNDSPTTLHDFILRIFNLFTESRNREQYAQFRDTTILIEADVMSPVDFKMSSETRAQLFTAGQNAAKQYLEQLTKKTVPVRRHSL
jgi:NTE family protein